MQFQHPHAAGRTVVLLTAANGRELISGSKALWDPVVQAGCQGDLTFLYPQAGKYDTLAMQVGSNYFLGKPGTIPVIQNLVNTYPLIFLIALLMVLLLLLALTKVYIRKRRKRRIAKSMDQ